MTPYLTNLVAQNKCHLLIVASQRTDLKGFAATWFIVILQKIECYSERKECFSDCHINKDPCYSLKFYISNIFYKSFVYHCFNNVLRYRQVHILHNPALLKQSVC